MLWRIIYDTLKWLGISFFPAIGFVILAGIGIGQTFPESKPWLTLRYHEAIAAMILPSFWIAAICIFFVWCLTLTFARLKVGEDRVGGDTHIHHHYGTLQERLAETVESRSMPIQPDRPVNAQITGVVTASEVGSDTLDATGVLGLSGLYIGNIIAAADKLASHHRLELAITGFNGTGESISIVKIEGHVSAALSGSQDRLEMPVPALQKLVALQPFDEFTLIIHQEFDPKLTARFLVALERDHITLYLGELVIGLASQTNPAKRGSLPLWDGVILKRRDDLVSTRVQIRAAIARATGKGTAKGISE